MFGLRSSPSTLVVPCSLRGAVTAEAGMGFAPLRLTAPRPKRAVMPVMYYDAVSGSGGGGIGIGSGGQGYSPSTAAVSEYAGVFESGCDPAQVRASLICGSRRSATRVTQAQAASPSPLVEEAEAPPAPLSLSGGGQPRGCKGRGRADDDQDVDCLFEMEGLMRDDGRAEEEEELTEKNVGESRRSEIRGGMSAHAGTPPHVGHSVEPAAAGAGAGAVTEPAPARVDGGSGGVASTAWGGWGAPSLAVSGEKAAGVGGGGGVSNKAPPLLRTPRVMAHPGRRCIAGGMYRLRLSTSC